MTHELSGELKRLEALRVDETNPIYQRLIAKDKIIEHVPDLLSALERLERADLLLKRFDTDFAKMKNDYTVRRWRGEIDEYFAGQKGG